MLDLFRELVREAADTARRGRAGYYADAASARERVDFRPAPVLRADIEVVTGDVPDPAWEWPLPAPKGSAGFLGATLMSAAGLAVLRVALLAAGEPGRWVVGLGDGRVTVGRAA